MPFHSLVRFCALALAIGALTTPGEAARANASSIHALAGAESSNDTFHETSDGGRKIGNRMMLKKRSCKRYDQNGSLVLQHCKQRVVWTGKVWLRRVPVCVRWRYAGKFRWNRAFVPDGYGSEWWNFRFVNPYVRYRGFSYYGCNSSVEIRRKMGSSKVTANIYGSGSYGCDLNPRISVGLPFSISVSITPECGEKTRRSRWNDSLDPNGGRYKFVFGKKGRALRVEPHTRLQGYSARVCFTLTLTGKVGNVRDSRSQGFERKARACPDPTPYNVPDGHVVQTPAQRL